MQRPSPIAADGDGSPAAPAPADPSSSSGEAAATAGRESPFGAPPAGDPPAASAAATNDGDRDASAAPAPAAPLGVRLHLTPPPWGGGQTINIVGTPGGTINVVRGHGPGPGGVGGDGGDRPASHRGRPGIRRVVNVVRAPAGAGRGGGGGPMPMPMPMLPPLEPRPLPNQTSEGSGDGTGTAASGGGGEEKDAEVDMKRFECAICFEYMDRPVGCGSCQTRFCAPCLERVRREEINNRPPNSPDPPDSAKCPHCRSLFTVGSVFIDQALQEEIAACTDTVTCPFEGCGTELHIGKLKSHEATCPYMRVRCRYAEWGCAWAGRKMHLAHHDEIHCEFRRGLGRLVERFRQQDARAGHLLQQHHMQVGAQGQMLALHARQAMTMRARNAWSFADVLRLAYESTLFPGRLAATRDLWLSLISQQEARCAVCNIMLMMPSVALALHVSLRSFRLVSGIQLHTLSEDDLWFLFDEILLALTVPLLGILCISCFFVDSNNAADWTLYHVRSLIQGQPIMRDLAAMCMAMIHFVSIEFCGMHPGWMLWVFTAFTTVFYTSFVARVVEKCETSALNARIMKNARAWPVVIFGMRYGFLTVTCGVGPSMNAVVALRLLETTRLMPSTATAEDSECFLAQMGISHLLTLAGLASTIHYAVESTAREIVADAAIEKSGVDFGAISWQKIVYDWAIATSLLIMINLQIFAWDWAGAWTGDLNVRVGNGIFAQANRSSGAAVPNLKPTPIGCFVFGLCSFLLLCIIVS